MNSDAIICLIIQIAFGLVGASIVAIAGLYKLTGDLRPATMMLPL